MNSLDTINCEEALRLLATYLDHELREAESAAVQQHLELCRSCFSRAEFELRLKQQLAGLGQQRVSSELEDRIRALLR